MTHDPKELDNKSEIIDPNVQEITQEHPSQPNVKNDDKIDPPEIKVGKGCRIDEKLR